METRIPHMNSVFLAHFATDSLVPPRSQPFDAGAEGSRCRGLQRPAGSVRKSLEHAQWRRKTGAFSSAKATPRTANSCYFPRTPATSAGGETEHNGGREEGMKGMSHPSEA